MATLITGAAGYIGTQLAIRLAQSGEQIVAFTRSSPNNKLLEYENVRTVKGDICDRQSVEEAIQGCELVYHLAALCSISKKDVKSFYHINVEGAVNLFEAALQNQVKRVVFTSTGGTTGPQHNGQLITEDNERIIDFFNEYERTKTIAEEKAKEYCDKGLDVVIVNPTRVMGPGVMSRGNAVTYLIKKYVENNWRFVPGNGESMGNYAFVEDVVNGHLLAMEKGRKGEKYLLGGENASWNELFKVMAQASGKKNSPYRVPLPAMMLIAHISNGASKLFHNLPLITPPWVKRYTYDWGVDISKAKNELGYENMPLKEAVATTIKWLEENN